MLSRAKTGKIFMAYSIVITVSNMKSRYKRPVVTSDNYQVMLSVICKGVHIKQMFKVSTSVLTQAHRLHVAGHLPRR